MYLHIQKRIDLWGVIDLGPAKSRKSKPLLEQIRDALQAEDRTPSKQRKCAGFHVVLTPDEKKTLYDKMRGLHEFLRGELTDDQVRSILSDTIEASRLGIKLYGYNARHEKRISAKKAALEPDFCIALDR